MGRSMGGGGGGSRGGGGGRSMGGGSRSGSRSFSGSGRSGIGSSGSHRTIGSSGSSSFNHSNSGNHYSSNHYNNGYHNNYHHHNHYGGNYYGPARRSSGCGCSSIFFIMILVVILLAFMSVRGSISGSNKKLNREKYEGAVDSSQGYYLDDSDPSKGKFIDNGNEKTLISGFKNFYSRTGVFPFLYVAENLPSQYSTPQDYIDALYEQLFKEEGNLLILYIAEKDDYYYACGYNVGEVIDEESLNLISDRVNAKWSSGDLAKAFGKGLDDASVQIMAKSNARVIGMTIVIAIAAIVIILILYKWWQKRIAQKNKEQEDLERTLNTPLETFGQSPIDELANKYDDK